MPSRVSIPLAICLLASAVAVIALTGVFDGSAETAQPAAQAVVADTAETSVETTGASAPAQAASITIADFAFGESLTVQPGQTVSVENVDGAPHTVTATEGAFDTGNLAGGSSGSFTAPTEPGNYAFFCQIHPSMTGTITVAS